MEVLYPRCAGLDVHKENVVASARLQKGREITREVREFATTTRGLIALLKWLLSHGVTHVGMEATGVYWKPVWHILEGHFDLVLGNAREIKNVPGRKTDVADATWIADLLAHGLIRGSFVPPQAIQELRDLTRTRKQLVRERSRHVQRIQKVLEDANVKLQSVVSDVLGASGRAMLEAMVRGEEDPTRLAALADPRLKATRAELVEALEGRVTDHHRFMLTLHLGQIEAADRALEVLDQKTQEVLDQKRGEGFGPFRPLEERLMTIPGVKELTARVILAEIGMDMSRFPTAGHLVSWARLCPGHDESAGKKRTSKSRPGGWLKTTLVQAAWGAVRKKDHYLHAQFVRIKSRRGSKKAILAVAASMLTAAYHMLQNENDYSDLGADYFQRRDRHKNANRLVRRLQELGYEVDVRAAA